LDVPRLSTEIKIEVVIEGHNRKISDLDVALQINETSPPVTRNELVPNIHARVA
jgi:hypothetical protein